MRETAAALQALLHPEEDLTHRDGCGHCHGREDQE